MIRRLLVLALFAALPFAAHAQGALSTGRALQVRLASEFTGTCVSGSLGKASDTGDDYRCVNHAWIISSCGGWLTIRLDPDEAATNQYAAWVPGTTSAPSTPVSTVAGADIQVSPGVATQVRALACTSVTPPNTGKSWVIAFNAGGSDSALTCTISGSATTCTDTAHVVTLAANTKVAVHVTGVSNPDASTELLCSVCVGP